MVNIVHIYTKSIVCLIWCMVICVQTVRPFQCHHNVLDSHHNEVDFITLVNFTNAMCARCYWYISDAENAWANDSIVTKTIELTYWPDVGIRFIINNQFRTYPFTYAALNATDWENDFFLKNFENEFYMNTFMDCCKDAKKCCEKQIIIAEEEDDDEKDNTVGHYGRPNTCPTKWDGWMCWDSAAADSTHKQKCPAMSHAALGYEPTPCAKESATKKCLANGTWATKWVEKVYEQPEHGYYPDDDTFYEYCTYPKAHEELRQARVSTYVFILSLVLCCAGVAVFVFYEQHKILRVQIHMNFIGSIILTCVFSIMFNYLLREAHFSRSEVIQHNPKWCRALVIFYKFSHISNFCWMLNEAAYLHRRIVLSFAEERHPLYYYLFGWGAPLLVMVPYVIVHALDEYDTNCWTKPMLYPELIYDILPITCIVLNALLLFNVVRVLMTKLRSSPDHFRAGLRASLILLPVFGIQYTFYIVDFDPFDSCTTGVFVIKYIQIVIEAIQGAIVTTIFCFLNGEVHIHVRRTMNKLVPKSSIMLTEQQELEKTTS